MAFPMIARAKLEIAGQKAENDADPKAPAAIVRLNKLSAGKTPLKAWFTDADGKDLRGAFFVTVVQKL